MAAEYGVHPVTIRRIIAEPRGDFLARAKARRERAVELRATGLKHREIAAEMDVPIGTVGRLLHEARKLAEAQVVVEQPQAS
ncbi:sigma factor-like helix-turn-helix DNA-binding protein [Kineococcus rubinsiae]|uniref:sigma factor-like helix-turn-helix DNA-binding protein n=1 Tax=Kineococcus rubinsiae TaxID=2609562 RepID=UPI0014300A73|nr:helix-turn-helix domain-containing protein [Kineococcus rubinsiae]NIZ93491.1 replication protein RepB [Kineococcus rubinsiae]